MLVSYGLSHSTAPLLMREQWCVTAGDVTTHLRDCHLQPAVNEALVLSTCNRTEWYVHTQSPEALMAWVRARHPHLEAPIAQYTYCHQASDAVLHALRVASGLDSMVLGETEIFGQMKQAYTTAKQAGTLGPALEHMFQFVFAKAKAVRTETQINAHPLSIAFVAVNLAKRIFSQLKQTRVLLVGAGETVDLLARYCHQASCQQLLFANRTLAKAQSLATRYQGEALPLTDIPSVLAEVDVVISATNSPLAIIGKGLVQRALRLRKHKPMLMIDLAIPRDIEPEVGALADVYLYNIDDLNDVVTESVSKRRDAAEFAEQLVKMHSQTYAGQLKAREHEHLITQYRDSVTQLREQLLAKALHQLRQGGCPEAVLQQFAHQLTNQLMHAPSTALRQACKTGDRALLDAAAELLAL